MQPKKTYNWGTTTALLAAGAVAALTPVEAVLGARPTDLVGTSGIDTIRKQQEASRRSRGKLKRSARAASAELTRAGHKTIVLGHIHPRWLREMVDRKMDDGELVTHAQIDKLRAMGRQLAEHAEGLFVDTCGGDGRPCIDEVGPRCDTSLCGRLR